MGLIGALAAGPSHADEMYSFTTLVNGLWRHQTLIHCQEPARMNGRIPERCTLSERATAFLNTKFPRIYEVTCAAGHPIVFPRTELSPPASSTTISTLPRMTHRAPRSASGT